MKKKFLLACGFCFVLGCVYFLIHQERLIVLWSKSRGADNVALQRLRDSFTKKKNVKLYYWKENRFCFEEVVPVWFSDEEENIKYVINSWLNLAYQEQVLDRKFFLTAVGLVQFGQGVYFSFDGSFFGKDWSIVKKWYFVESLLKTVREVFPGLGTAYFRIKHQLFEDDHLDFSQGWPMGGFLERV